MADMNRLGPRPIETGATIRSCLEAIRSTARMDLGERHQGLENLHQARTEITSRHAFSRPAFGWMAVLEHTAAVQLGHIDKAGTCVGGPRKICRVPASSAC